MLLHKLESFAFGLFVFALGSSDLQVRAQAPATTAERVADFSNNSDEAKAVIRDGANLFKPETIDRATALLTDLQKRIPLNVIVETIPELKGETIREATSRHMEIFGAPGLFVLIDKLEHKFDVMVSPQFRRSLGGPEQTLIRDAFLVPFRSGEFDHGLLEGIQAIVNVVEKSGIKDQFGQQKTSEHKSIGLITKDKIRLSLEGAHVILAGAVAKAGELRVRSNIAVVDDGGHLIAFERMDGARSASISTSITKATSAATFQKETGPMGGKSSSPTADPLLDISMQLGALSSGGKFTTLSGGIPITVDGQIIGGIGVGGGTGEQDKEVAQAGIDRFLKALSVPADAGNSFGDAEKSK